MWVRGLKSHHATDPCSGRLVAPHVGAWIEIPSLQERKRSKNVAPHVGAWIEIMARTTTTRTASVAPHVGAWIEIVIVNFA